MSITICRLLKFIESQKMKKCRRLFCGIVVHENFKRWCKLNHLLSIETKTQSITIYKKNSPKKKVNFIKILGFYIQDNLKWNKNTEMIIKKSASRLYNVHNTKTEIIFPKNQLIIIFNGLILSIIDYACQTYGTFPQTM